MKTVTYDPVIYKLVPIKPTLEMMVMASEWSTEPKLCYLAALSEVPEPLLTYPAHDAIAIVKATLEAAAALAVQWGNARKDINGGLALRNYAEACSAINPESVLDGLNK